jgi:hypothetical protein
MYRDPILTIGVLDFAKPIESHLCLQSIKQHVKVAHKVVFCDNGSGEDYALQFLRDGLIDQLIINRESTGLGLGTRDIMNASFSTLTLMMQNDQLFVRDLSEEDVRGLAAHLGTETTSGGKVASINIAGPVAPVNRYAERAHLIGTTFYKDMERRGVLGYAGAGKYHDAGPWREASIQELYAKEHLVHWTPPVAPWVQDNGVYGLRDMGEGGVWLHRTDTKAAWVIVIPTGDKNPAYPKMTDEEFAVAKAGLWVDARIPEAEVAHSFDCWSNTMLAQMEEDYVKDMRRRFREKGR